MKRNISIGEIEITVTLDCLTVIICHFDKTIKNLEITKT